jgi:hypothetical protein
MAITGAGGTVSLAFCSVTDNSIGSILKSIVGHAKWNRDALRIESGIWVAHAVVHNK